MPSVAKGSPEPERGGERFVAKGVARVLDELASPFVAKQRRAPDEGADKRDRQLARLILRTASPVNDATAPKRSQVLRPAPRPKRSWWHGPAIWVHQEPAPSVPTSSGVPALGLLVHYARRIRISASRV
jgi:hypothetical protein